MCNYSSSEFYVINHFLNFNYFFRWVFLRFSKLKSKIPGIYRDYPIENNGTRQPVIFALPLIWFVTFNWCRQTRIHNLWAHRIFPYFNFMSVSWKHKKNIIEQTKSWWGKYGGNHHFIVWSFFYWAFLMNWWSDWFKNFLISGSWNIITKLLHLFSRVLCGNF